MKNFKLNDFVFLPILLILIPTFLFNGYVLVTADRTLELTFLNFLNRQQFTGAYWFIKPALLVSGITAIIAGIVIGIGFLKKEFLSGEKNVFFKWGILSAITSVIFYGGVIRVISNHAMSATLFFYSVILYLLLWLIENRSTVTNHAFNNVKLLPMYLMILYTIAFPGFQKIFNPGEVMANYNMMFQGSFLVKVVGTIDPFIYFLGFMELLAPTLLIISLIRMEFLDKNEKVFLSWSLFTTMLTFVFLSFGLTIIINYPGATNLIIYCILTLLLYFYVKRELPNVSR